MKFTPKRKVLKLYPKAYAYRWAGPQPWCIYANDGKGTSLNVASRTAAEAWREAWDRSKETRA